MHRLIALLLTLLAILVMGCGSVATSPTVPSSVAPTQPPDTAIPAAVPTVDIAATVEARVQATIAAQPALSPTATLIPTPATVPTPKATPTPTSAPPTPTVPPTPTPTKVKPDPPPQDPTLIRHSRSNPALARTFACCAGSSVAARTRLAPI